MKVIARKGLSRGCAIAMAALVGSLLVQDGTTAPSAANPPEPVAIQAAGRGNPYINFEDGRAIPARFSGGVSLASALANPTTKGLALASADFDEDGMPDLVAAYDSSKGGLLSLHFGNVDAVYSNAPEAKERRAKGTFVDAPFLPDAKLFETPERPDFIGAGDFDADGHWDIVAARQGGQAVALHRGDGAGGFHPSESLPLPGAVTTLATGDVNRRDGLEDVLVGVVTPDGPRLLVYEWPEGALKGEPAVIDLPEATTGLALGQLDEEYPIDMAVAAGQHVVRVLGRDRRLSFEKARRVAVGPARIDQVDLGFPVASVVIGDLDADRRREVVALTKDGRIHALHWTRTSVATTASIERVGAGLFGPARLQVVDVSAGGGDSLLVVNPAAKQLTVLFAEPDAAERQTLQRWAAEEESRRRESSTAPSTRGEMIVDDLDELAHRMSSVPTRHIARPHPARSLESARSITMDLSEPPAAALGLRLNADAIEDLVVLSSDGLLIELPTAPLAILTVTNVNDSGSGSLRAAIATANSGFGTDTIAFDIPGPGPHVISLVTRLPALSEPVTIDGTTEPDFAGKPVVEIDGNAVATIAGGLHVFWHNVTIRGLAIGGFTVSGGLVPESAGIIVDQADKCFIEGNFVGLDASGTAVNDNLSGIVAAATEFCTIGGTTAAARNVAAGNRFSQISVEFVMTADLEVLALSKENVVRGNYVGTDWTGSVALSPSVPAFLPPTGIQEAGIDNTIGGPIAGTRNVVTAPDTAVFSGCRCDIVPSGLLVQGNYVGTNAAGSTVLGPPRVGIGAVSVDAMTVGGTTPSARNVISGATSSGAIRGNLFLFFSLGPDGSDIPTTNAIIQGNYIGTNRLGVAGLGGVVGLQVTGLNSSHLIGGSFTAARNVIAAHVQSGIELVEYFGRDPVDITIQGNLIGLNASGDPLGNGGDGLVLREVENNTVGGSAAGAGNVISSNALHGILIDGSGVGGNIIQGNRIGTNAPGMADMGNGSSGISIIGARLNLIGGSDPGEGNLISGNSGPGVRLSGVGTTLNTLQGNLIGTDESGTIAIPNSDGVVLEQGGNVVGGVFGEEGNLISGNLGTGIVIRGSHNNSVRGNLIGCDIAGSAPLGNARGIFISDAPTFSFIGGPALADRNIVSANGTNLILLGYGRGTEIEGNYFGTDASGTMPLGSGASNVEFLDSDEPYFKGNIVGGNYGVGVRISGGVYSYIYGNKIGLGATLGPIGLSGPGILFDGISHGFVFQNTIANNAGAGIQVIGPAIGNIFDQNSIHSNGELGIDLGGDGVTPNDPADTDAGPNDLLNFPVLTSATTTGGSVTVTGTLNSAPSELFNLYFYANSTCDPSGHGEGETFVSFITVSTDASGNASFSRDLVAPVGAGDEITAVTGDFARENTSEFSACVAAVGVPPPAPTAVEFPSPLALTWDAVPGASQYHIYAGTDLTLFSMAAPDDDVCEVGAVPTPGVQLPEASGPPPGHMFWVVLTSEGFYGEGPPQPAGGGPSDFSSAGLCGDSCAHDQCDTGGPLQSACTLCASIMCDTDPSCCTTEWNESCVQKVRTVCRSLSCPESAGQCAHEACAQGEALQPGCDVPPLAVSCTAAICQIDPHCCQQGWDSACIAHVPSVCGYNCF